jgi:hypothetical protein
MVQPFSAARRSGFFLRIDRADGLGHALEGRVLRVNLHLGEQGGKRNLDRQQIAQLLLDHVADHAFGFGTEYVQRVGVLGVVGIALQGQQADLRAITVGDYQLVALGDLGDLFAGNPHIVALVFRGHGFAAA